MKVFIIEDSKATSIDADELIDDAILQEPTAQEGVQYIN